MISGGGGETLDLWSGVFPFLAALAFAVAPTTSNANAASACQGADPVSAKVDRVVDALTVLLHDGREVRIAGLAAPALPPGETATTLGRAAMAVLEELLRGKDVALHGAAGGPDRYGRWHAHVFVIQDGLEGSAAHVMLRRGLAWVAPRVGAVACARELLAMEAEARKAGAGVWSGEAALHRADAPDALLAARGGLQLVEGRVLSVRESGGTIYINFGRRWSEDFTATIPKREERRFVAAGLTPKSLERRRVRIRGYVEERGGPWIEVRHVEQIELIQD